MATNKEPENNACVNCGDPVGEAKDRMQDFQTEIAEEIYCPNCRYQKHFGVIHSE